MLESNGRNWSEIEEEAARLFVKLRSEPDEAEQAAIYQWIEASPAHAVAFARIEAIWEESEQLRDSDRSFQLEDKAGPAQSGWFKTYPRNLVIGGALAASVLLAGVGATAKISGGDFGFSSESDEGDQCRAGRSKK